MIKYVYEKYKALFAYAFFGVCTTIVNTVVYWAFADLFHFSVVPSAIAAWFFAVLFAYFTNRKWVFCSQAASKAEIFREILSFYSCRIATGMVDWLCMYVFVSMLHFNDLIVKVAANVLVIILNYVTSKVLIFKKTNIDKEMPTKNKKTSKTGIICGVFLFLAALAMSINTHAFPFSGKLSGTDSSVFRYVASIIVDGGMPYIDTFDHKGPVIYLINALGALISEHFGLWLIELFFIFISFLFAYKIARLMNCSRVTSCAVIILNMLTLTYYLEGGNLVEEYACAFLMFSLYVFLEFFKTSHTNALKLILCGASFAAVCLLRLNMVVLWGVMCIGVLVCCIRTDRSKKICGFVLWFLLGIAFVFVPIIVWLWARGALTSFIEDYWLFNLAYSSDPSRSSLINKVTSLVYFSTSIPVAVVAPTLVFFCFNKQKKIDDWLCLIALGLSLLSICISGQKYNHYGMILCPIVVYAISRLFAEIEVKLSFSSKVYRWQRFGTALSLLCAVLLLFSTPAKTMVTNILHLSTHPDHTIAEYQIAEIVRSHTSADDKISVCGNNNIIYLLSERKSISKYSYQSPIASVDSKIKEEYLNDIKQLQPKIIVMYEDVFLYDELLAIIEGDYKMIDSVGIAEVYEKIT